MAANESQLPHTPPEQHVQFRERVEEAFQSVAGVIKASAAPLPTKTGDGSYIADSKPSGLLDDLAHLRHGDVRTLIDVAKSTVTGDPINDKTLLMERLLKLASELPANNKESGLLSNELVQQLYDNLQHPPVAQLGNEYRYRAADGSFNNVMAPKVGAARSHYARSVRPQTMQTADLPDPADLFDSLMARDHFKPHPAKLSSMLFYLASIIIHDLFRTDRWDTTKTNTSSYLDLAPLYGCDQTEQDAMRTFKDGKIKPDCFSSKRILGFPPGVGAMLIMFNRFHNYVVDQLASINEASRFAKPKDDADKKADTKYDNDLFQTARLITCGLYVNIILKDYVRTILNLNRTDSDWDLDPRTAKLTGPTANGTPGNQVSAEFNLVYRWHACVSENDDKWTKEEYARLFPGKDPSQVSMTQFLTGLGMWEAGLSQNPQERSFANLQRSTDGSLDDDALVKILADGTENVAGAFGSTNVPTILKAVEILGIKQARSWNLATLNEFRAFFNLEKHESFESINSDPKIADALKHFYDEPDLVELYPGLVVEETKPLTKFEAGSGLCTDDTISRAILSDAVTLIRGDRFYTVDYTPNNLTNWGFHEVSSDVTVDHGHVIYKLFLRAFPNHFQPNSIYAHYPFVIPEENHVILTKFEQVDKYDFNRPAPIQQPTPITSYAACKSTLENQQNFKVTWGKAIKFLMHNSGKEFGADFMLSGDAPANANSRRVMGSALYRDKWEDEVKSFYETITLQLLREKSYKISGTNQVDIVRDVGNLAQVHFSAEVFCLPLKTEKNPTGVYTESQLYSIMALVFICIFFDEDPAQSFPLRQAARTLTQQLGEIMETLIIPEAREPTVVNTVLGFFHKHSALSKYGLHMIHQLFKSGLSTKDIIWSQVLPTAGGMIANQAQLFAQNLDFYLEPENAGHLKEINRLAKLDTPEADDSILRYFMEGTRMRATVGVYRDVATMATIQDGDRKVHVIPGDEVFVDCIAASQDPIAFPEPERVKLDRPMDSYIHYGQGPHQCLGYGLSKLAMMTMLKTVGKLDNLRRAPGVQGQIKKITGPGGVTLYMTADHSRYFPFPTTMKVRWDGELPPMEV